MTVNGASEFFWDGRPISAWLPMTRASVMCVKISSCLPANASAGWSERSRLGTHLCSEFRDLGLPGRARMPDRGTPESAVVHGFAFGFLVFKLPDQLTLCFTQSPS
jgi:hypothetical protein